MIGNYFYHFFGLQGAGPVYAFWSGIGSDISEVMILSALITLFHKHNCHEKGCWRIGRHIVDGSPWCNKHHRKARENVV